MISEIVMFINRNLKKPLNVQIDETRDYLSSYFIKANDEILCESNNAEFGAKSSGASVPYSFKVNVNGTVRVSFTIKSSSSSTMDFYGDKNGIQVFMASHSGTIYTQYSQDVEVSKGDILSFRLMGAASATYSYLQANSLNLCGTLEPLSTLNLIEVTEG